MTQEQIDPKACRLCVRVAKLYYEVGLTQQEIAEKLGISRIKVHRILNQARELGVVEVVIHTPEDGHLIELEHKLVLRYNLRDALVVPEALNGETHYHTLARGAAAWLEANLAPGMRIGLGLGRTISHLPLFFNPENKVDCIFTEVVGGSSENTGGIAKYNVTSKMAELAGGRAEMLYAPNMVSNRELQRRLISEPAIAEALARARQSDIIMQSIGTVDETAILLVENRISQAELQHIQEAGAVGDALGHYYDQAGKPVATLMDERVIGLSLADIREVPWSVVVAGGVGKHKALRGALLGGFFNMLVTDNESALFLLDD